MKVRKKYVIGWFIFVLIVFAILYKVNAQALNAPLFGTETTPVLTDTLINTSGDSIITSRTITYNMPKSMSGSTMLSGNIELLSGTGVNVLVTARMLVDAATSQYGEVHTVGTITAPTDSSDWDFNLNALTWYGYCDGLEVIFTEATNGTYSMQLEARLKKR